MATILSGIFKGSPLLIQHSKISISKKSNYSKRFSTNSSATFSVNNFNGMFKNAIKKFFPANIVELLLGKQLQAKIPFKNLLHPIKNLEGRFSNKLFEIFFKNKGNLHNYQRVGYAPAYAYARASNVNFNSFGRFRPHSRNFTTVSQQTFNNGFNINSVAKLFPGILSKSVDGDKYENSVKTPQKTELFKKFKLSDETKVSCFNTVFSNNFDDFEVAHKQLEIEDKSVREEINEKINFFQSEFLEICKNFDKIEKKEVSWDNFSNFILLNGIEDSCFTTTMSMIISPPSWDFDELSKLNKNSGIDLMACQVLDDNFKMSFNNNIEILNIIQQLSFNGIKKDFITTNTLTDGAVEMLVSFPFSMGKTKEFLTSIGIDPENLKFNLNTSFNLSDEADSINKNSNVALELMEEDFREIDKQKGWNNDFLSSRKRKRNQVIFDNLKGVGVLEVTEEDEQFFDANNFLKFVEAEIASERFHF